MMVRMPCHGKIEPASDHFSINSDSSMQLNQDSASLVHDGACLISSSRPPLAAIGSQLCVPLPHEIAEPANSGLQRNTHPNIPDNSFHTLREHVDSALRESFAP